MTAKTAPAAQAMMAAATRMRGVRETAVDKWGTVTLTFNSGATLTVRATALGAAPVKANGRVVGQLDLGRNEFRSASGRVTSVLGRLDALTMLTRNYL